MLGMEGEEMAKKTQNDITEGEIQTGEDWTRPVWRPERPVTEEVEVSGPCKD